MNRFLDANDLKFLTDLERPADQRRWLDERGIHYWIGAKGRPKVLWSTLENAAQRGDSRRPDFSRIR